MKSTDLLPFAGGAAAGALSAHAARLCGPRWSVVGLAGGLVTAAAIYPLARKPVLAGTDRTELLTLAASAVAAAIAGTGSASRGRRVIAAGWASHALFDALHGVRGDSRLPNWYPAMCAGYDVAVAAAFVTPRDVNASV